MRTFTKNELLFEEKFRDDFEIGNSLKAIRHGRLGTKAGIYVADFDDVTPADCAFLQLCKSNCDIFIVSIPTDYSGRLNGKIFKFEERERIFRLGTLYPIDLIVAFDEKDCGLSLDKIDPDFIFYGRTQNDIETYNSRKSIYENKFQLIDYPWREERGSGKFFQV